MPEVAAPAPMRFAKSSRQVAAIIIAFAEELTKADADDPGKKMYPSQRAVATAVIEAVLEGAAARTLTALFSRQSGKTEVVALLMLALAVLLPGFAANFPGDPRFRRFRRGVRVGIYGPIQEKAQLPFDRMREYAETAWAAQQFDELDVQLTVSRGNTLAWSNGSIICAKTASPAVNNEGDTWHVMVVEEAQLISRKKLDKELFPTLSSTAGPALLIGTAGGARGAFYEICNANIAHEHRTGERLHFQYDWRAIDAERTATYEAEGRRYAKYLGLVSQPAERAKLLEKDPAASYEPNKDHLIYGTGVRERLRTTKGGEDNEEFRQNYNLEWIDSRSIALTDDDLRRAALPHLHLNQPRSIGRVPVIAGLDLAKGANAKRDQTVLSFVAVDPTPAFDPIGIPAGPEAAPLYNKTLVGLVTASGDFELSQARTIIDAMYAWSHVCRVLVVDANGLGTFQVTRLQALLPWVKVIAFNSADEGEKAEAYGGYIGDWKAGRFGYPDSPLARATFEHEEFLSQHVTLQQRPGRRGGIVCEAEEGEHDDYPDSIAMACSRAHEAIAEIAGHEVEVHPASTSYAARAQARHYRRNPQHDPRGAVVQAQVSWAHAALANVGRGR